MRGIPVRVELGPKDIEAGKCVLARRDTGEKIEVALEELEAEDCGAVGDDPEGDVRACKGTPRRAYLGCPQL